jgi:hypothetical protein
VTLSGDDNPYIGLDKVVVGRVLGSGRDTTKQSLANYSMMDLSGRLIGLQVAIYPVE